MVKSARTKDLDSPVDLRFEHNIDRAIAIDVLRNLFHIVLTSLLANP
jgi:hypothetical protein